MRERVPMTDFARQWAEHVAASASPDDRRPGGAGLLARLHDTQDLCPEPSALQVLERLRPLPGPRVETALEVGPGWGSYTMTLAELCREVACVDLSRDVLDFVLRAGRSAAGTISPPSMPSGRSSRRSGGTIWSSAITASTGRRIWPTASGGWTGRRTSCAWRA